MALSEQDRIHGASGALCTRVLSAQELSETPPEGSADSLPSGKSAGLVALRLTNTAYSASQNFYYGCAMVIISVEQNSTEVILWLIESPLTKAELPREARRTRLGTLTGNSP